MQGNSEPPEPIRILWLLGGAVVLITGIGLWIRWSYQGKAKEVTDNPKYVGTFRSGQIYILKSKLAIDGDALVVPAVSDPSMKGISYLEAGQRLLVGKAYYETGINYKYVDLFATPLDNPTTRDKMKIRSVCLTDGTGNPGSGTVLGPNPKYQELERPSSR